MADPANLLIDLALSLAPSIFGGTVWRRQGAGWLEILSWTMPVTIMTGAGLLFASGVIRVVLVVAASALLAAMMLSPTAIAWWRLHVARQSR